VEGGGSERAQMRQRKGTRIAMAATNGCQFCDLLTKRPSGSPRQGNRTLSTIPHISHSTKTITSIITASRERERERERYDMYIYIFIFFFFFFFLLRKKRLVEGTMKSLAPERGNHF